jgi:ATP-binding protein involved in chromosome partitioning
MPDLKEAVRQALSTVEDPDLKKDLVTLGMIRNLEVDPEGKVSVTVCLTTPACPMKEKIQNDCDDRRGRRRED